MFSPAAVRLLRVMLVWVLAALAIFAAQPGQAVAAFQHVKPTSGFTTTAKLRGTVLDKVTNMPIPFASVSVKNSKTHTLANAKGDFVLQLHEEDLSKSLMVTSVGYLPGEFPLAEVRKGQNGSVRLLLVPSQKQLNEVEVRARTNKWKSVKVGYHIGEGTDFQHEVYPMDTIVSETEGQQLGNRIILKKKPAALQKASFGLSGSGGEKVIIHVRLFSLMNDLPHQELLPEPVLVTIPPHHTGWINVNLQQYNLTLTEDIAFVIEWLTETNKLNDSSLMAFATHPKGQLTYYRPAPDRNWEILKSTLINTRSNGFYLTLLYKK